MELFFLAAIGLLNSCSKGVSHKDGDTGTDTTAIPPVVITPVDPAVANTIGFFLDNWKVKNFTIPPYAETAMPSTPAAVTVTLDPSEIITKVPGTVFGQNANSWMTQMVTESSLLNNISNLKPNIIRFPGGSISDVYFWNALPDAPPADIPAALVDANGNPVSPGFWYGKNFASWTISLDNYYNMLQMTGSVGIITVNYAYARYSTAASPVPAAAHLAAEWVRYDNGRTKYWEIGNEDNGTWEAGYRINTTTNHDAQPQIITGDLYGKHAKVFIDSMKQAAVDIGKTIFIGTQLLESPPASWQTPTDQTWNSGVLAQVKDATDFYIIHSYFTPYQENSSAELILNTAVNNTAAMINYLKTTFTAAGAAVRPVALTEWNITSQGSRQQVSFINGMHAAILLGEALKNKYGEASRWDFANGWNNGNDHGLFNIGDEPGVSKWNPRPAFYYMYFFQRSIGDRLVNSTVTGSADILSYASSYTSGEKGIILVNKGTVAKTAGITIKNATTGKRYYWYTLTGGPDNGEFSGKVFINGEGPAEVSGGPAGYSTLKANSALTQGGIKINLPARSVVYIVIDKIK